MPLAASSSKILLQIPTCARWACPRDKDWARVDRLLSNPSKHRWKNREWGQRTGRQLAQGFNQVLTHPGTLWEPAQSTHLAVSPTQGEGAGRQGSFWVEEGDDSAHHIGWWWSEDARQKDSGVRRWEPGSMANAAPPLDLQAQCVCVFVNIM